MVTQIKLKKIETGSLEMLNFTIQLKEFEESFLQKEINQIKNNYKCEIIKIIIFSHNMSIGNLKLSCDLPCLIVQNQYTAEEKKIMIEIQAIKIKDQDKWTFESITIGDRCLGVILSSSGIKFAYLTNLNLGKYNLKEEINESYQIIEKILRSNNIFPENIYRTWYYLSEIGENYKTFNTIRDFHFNNWKIKSFPASTGIDGRFSTGQSFNCMLEAVNSPNKNPIKKLELSTQYQCEPIEYGMKFVRANLLEFDDHKLLSISGISSIDTNGISIYQEDIEKNVFFTMQSFMDLLNEGGMNVDDLFSIYVYFKSAAVKKEFDCYLGENNLFFQYIYNYVDICRKDLMFEIEGKAIKGKG